MLIGLALAVGLAGAAIAASTIGSGRIGPASHITGNGRLLRPPGQLVTLGQFPTGGALTPDGRFYWTVSTGRALNDIRVVAVGIKHPRVIQILPLPGASGGIAIDPKRSRVYVSGVPDSTNTDQQRPGLRGRGGDVIHVFRYNRHSGIAHESGTIAVPPPPSAPVPQNFPPQKSGHESWPDRLAVSPNGATLLVPLNLADAAAVVDTRSRAVRYVTTGTYPMGQRSCPTVARGWSRTRGRAPCRWSRSAARLRSRTSRPARISPIRRELLSTPRGLARTWRSPTRTRSRLSIRDG